MSAQRSTEWYLLNDRLGEVAELDIKLDMIDIEIDWLRRIRWEETAARLERLGFDAEKLRPLPHLHRSEMRCAQHPDENTDVERIIGEAQARDRRSTRFSEPVDPVMRGRRDYVLDMLDESQVIYHRALPAR